MLYTYKQHMPDMKKAAFVAESANISGEVYAGEDSSFWFHTSIRGDIAPIYIGAGSNVQDNSVLHVTKDIPVKIGKNVTVGHTAILHSCSIDDNCLIGMGAIVLDNAEIGKESIVGAGALVTQGKKFPPRSLIIGSPAKVARELSDEDIEAIKNNAEEYIELAKEYEGSQ